MKLSWMLIIATVAMGSSLPEAFIETAGLDEVSANDVQLLQTDFLVESRESDVTPKIEIPLSAGTREREGKLVVRDAHELKESVSNGSRTELNFYHYSLLPLLLVTVITAWFTRPKLESTEPLSPAFLQHQKRFLLVWGVAVSADWLQGPYVYALYASFGYSKPDIDKLFVVGFASSMVFGCFVGSLADAWGRKRMTLLYCVLYIVSCLTKHCSAYGVLLFGRITGGMATSLLFSAFECWMVSESNEKHKFSQALLRYTFSMMYFVNYLVAIISGLIAQAFVESVPMTTIPGFEILHYGGNICPFDCAIVMLCIAFPMICFTWDENYGSTDIDSRFKPSVGASFMAAFRAITSSWKVCVIGLTVACFEGSMYAFVINWTPTLTVDGAPPPPHGYIFSAMMMCCMLGSSIFSFVDPKINPANVVVFACFLGALSFGVVMREVGSAAYVAATYICFLSFEFCVGLYFPSIGSLKSLVVPEEARAGIYNWYRVPLNVVVCSVILTDMNLRAAFAVCASLLVFAAASIVPVSLASVMPGKDSIPLDTDR